MMQLMGGEGLRRDVGQGVESEKKEVSFMASDLKTLIVRIGEEPKEID